ncbi:MAG: hypothetical protein ACREC0_05750 [Methylocella sp.]
MMDGNRQAATFAAIKQVGIGQLGCGPGAGHARLILEICAFGEMAAAFLGMSAPSRVIRPMRRTASSMATRFDRTLTERLANSAEPASTPPASTNPMRGDRGSSGIPSKTWGTAGARGTQESVGEAT